MKRIGLVLVLALSTSAFAEPANKVALTGADARALTLGLKLAGIAAVKVGDDLSYATAGVSCTTTEGGVTEDGLEVTSCQAAKALTGAPAAILSNALATALGSRGLPSEAHMSKTTITVASIACRITPDAKAPKSIDRFGCEVGLRQPLPTAITPKKKPIKDIVQPVRMEKQERQ